jgi:hypothetical protein
MIWVIHVGNAGNVCDTLSRLRPRIQVANQFAQQEIIIYWGIAGSSGEPAPGVWPNVNRETQSESLTDRTWIHLHWRANKKIASTHHVHDKANSYLYIYISSALRVLMTPIITQLFYNYTSTPTINNSRFHMCSVPGAVRTSTCPIVYNLSSLVIVHPGLIGGLPLLQPLSW